MHIKSTSELQKSQRPVKGYYQKPFSEDSRDLETQIVSYINLLKQAQINKIKIYKEIKKIKLRKDIVFLVRQELVRKRGEN